MALGPIQYLPQPKAFDLQQGLQIGGAIQGIRARSAEEEEQVLALKQANDMKQQYSLDLQEAFRVKTPYAFAMLTAKYPQQREAFKQSFSMISDEQKKNEIAIQGQIYNALNTGKQDVALKLVDERISAIKNANGDTAPLDKIRENIVNDPELAKGSLMFSLSNSMDPDKFAKYVETRGKIELQPGDVKKQKAELTKFAKDLNLKDAQITKIKAETKKLGLDSIKALMELESKKDKEGFITDPKELMKAEQALRKEYSSEASDFTKTQDAFRKIDAAEETAVGDLSLIFSFMKMLDPGSVVREGEFATAQNAAGVDQKIINIYNNIKSGERLSETQRKSFKSQANALLKAGEKKEQDIRNTITRSAKTFGIDPKNIFGIMGEGLEQDKSIPKASAESIQLGAIVTQGGKRYRKTEIGFEEVQ